MKLSLHLFENSIRKASFFVLLLLLNLLIFKPNPVTACELCTSETKQGIRAVEHKMSHQHLGDDSSYAMHVAKIDSVHSGSHSNTLVTKQISLFHSEAQPVTRSSIAEVLPEGLIISFKGSAITELQRSNPQHISMSLPAPDGSGEMEMELIRSEIFGPNFNVFTSDNPGEPIYYHTGWHYHGTVTGMPASTVGISIFEDEVYGLISVADGNILIHKIPDTEGDHLIYNDKHLTDDSPFECLTPPTEVNYTDEELNFSERTLGNCIQVYIELGNTTRDDRGGTIPATNWAVAVFHQSNLIFNAEIIQTAISSIFVWTSTDIYEDEGNPDAEEIRGLFQTRVTNNGLDGDLGQVITTHGGSGTGGIAAGVWNALIRPDDADRVCVTRRSASANYAIYPSYSRMVKVFNHELGHLLNSRHTHACVWNGDNTQIDDYGNVFPDLTLPTDDDDNPNPEGLACLDEDNPILNVTARIMSYFDSFGHGTFPMSNGYGTQSGNVIRAAVAAAVLSGDIPNTCSKPVNDICFTALSLSCGGSISGNTDNTNAAGAFPSCDGISTVNDGVWFTYSSPTSQYTVITTDHPFTDFDTRLRVFTSSGGVPCEGPFTCITGNDDIDFPTNANSQVSFIANAGTIYYIYLDGFANDKGNYNIRVDVCCNLPQAICKPAVVSLNANGEGSITVGDINNGSTTACGFSSMLASKTSFDCGDLGGNGVTLTVTDIYGNTSQCLATVTVEDNIPPTIDCPPLYEVAAGPGADFAIVSNADLGTPLADDNCGPPIVTSDLLTNYPLGTVPIGIHEITWTAEDVGENKATCSQTLIVYPAYYLKLNVLLQTAYDNVLDEMSTALNTAAQLPGEQPYEAEPWLYDGTEVIASPYVVSDEVVDWVLVEIRTDEETPFAQRAGRLLKSGVVVVDFDGIVEDGDDPYYVVVYHRNHIPVMSSAPITIPSTGTSYDFTQLANVYGEGAVMVDAGVYAMPAGDVNNDGRLQYSGPGNDRGPILDTIYKTATPPVFINTILTDGYWLYDTDLNNEVSYIGGPNDRAVIIANIGELLNTTLLTAIYESVVPGTVMTQRQYGAPDGPVSIHLTAATDGFGAMLRTNEPLKDGMLDNLQFTLAWYANDQDVTEAIASHSSDYMLQPQGEPVSVDGINYQVFASAIPVSLPLHWETNEQLRVLWFNVPGLYHSSRLWIADNAFTSQNNGMYYVSIWGSDHTGEVEQTVVSMGSTDDDNSFRVYPNPLTESILMVEYSGLVQQVLQIALYDATGKRVLHTSFIANRSGSTTVDVTGLQPGVYTLQLLGSGLLHKEKVVILR